MKVVLWVLWLLLLVSSECGRTTFYGYVSDDTITYTKITIPATARQLVLIFWCEPTTHRESQRQVVIGVNRVPTVSRYDVKYALPRGGELTTITENFPEESILYIGVWGGKMLHSYRYFGGSPVYTTVAVVADIALCDTETQREFACTVQPQISFLQSSSYVSRIDDETKLAQISFGSDRISLKLNGFDKVKRNLRFLPGQERVEIKLIPMPITLEEANVTEFCSEFTVDNQLQPKENIVVRIKGNIYLDRKSVDSHVVYSDAIVNVSTFCSDPASSSDSIIFESLLFNIWKPSPGLWTLEISVSINNTRNSNIIVYDYARNSNSASTGKKSTTTRCAFATKDQFHATLHSSSGRECFFEEFGAYSLFSPRTKNIYTAQRDNWVNLNVGIESQSFYCDEGFTSSHDNSFVSDCRHAIYDMHSFSYQGSSAFEYRLESEVYSVYKNFEVDTANFNTGVILRAGLEGIAFSPAGGSMSVDATFICNADFVNDYFTIYVKAGGLPQSDGISTAKSGVWYNTSTVLSQNMFELSPSTAQSRVRNTMAYSDNIKQKYDWVFDKPRLADTIQPQDGGYFMYFYVQLHSNGTLWNESDNAGCEVSLKAVLGPCLKSTCVHGDCVVTDDGVLVSFCSCR